MDDRQELANIVRSLFHRPDTKQLLPRGDINPAILHIARIPATGRVDRQAVRLRPAYRRLRVKTVDRLGRGRLPQIMLITLLERLDRLLAGLERLVFSACLALYLCLAIRPIIVYARIQSLPNHIMFILRHIPNLLARQKYTKNHDRTRAGQK